MSVPGPGHSEQEQELHKSLLRDEDDLDSEVEGALATEQIKPSVPPSAFAKHIQDPEHAALRKEYSNPAAQQVVEVKAEEKIKVSIPKERTVSRRRKSDMPYSDFYESISSQIPPQVSVRGTVSGRTTPLNDYEGDILEENPQYKNKAPPPPVVHRRTSIEWENFEESMRKFSYLSN
ncbi:unnamed protein product [Strongylus vulgaris]|uniref:Uncharacterized protein n=1 Tax=Strongylus vulgaris TaxID=40348 RepID=A0A3P7JAQ5_STRVU|nr:unnamed protein product [Strongylus vulgaris]